MNLFLNHSGYMSGCSPGVHFRMWVLFRLDALTSMYRSHAHERTHACEVLSQSVFYCPPELNSLACWFIATKITNKQVEVQQHSLFDVQTTTEGMGIILTRFWNLRQVH